MRSFIYRLIQSIVVLTIILFVGVYSYIGFFESLSKSHNSMLFDEFVNSTIVFGVVIIFSLLSIFILAFLLEIRASLHFRRDINKVLSGDYHHRVDLKRMGALADLARDFNSMLESINKHYKELELSEKALAKGIESKEQVMMEQQEAMLNVINDSKLEEEYAQGLVRDMEKFRLAVDYVSNHVVITDAEGVIIYANKACEKITGYKVSTLLGQKAGSKQNWGGTMSDEHYKKMWQTIKIDKKTYFGEMINIRANGKKYVAVVSISPILDKKGDVIFFVAVERDVTEERMIDQAKTEFVSLASHQLRTPLTGIGWYAEILLDEDGIDKKHKEFISEIYENNQRMVSLVNALLNVSRLELGTLAIEPELCSIKEIALDAVRELEPMLKEKKIKFSKKLGRIAKTDLDKTLTHMVFQNLLSNAVKYSEEKGKVSLSVSKTKTHIKITVSDNGMGIPKEQQDKIFSKLFRADNAKTSDTKGTGLGLYIVKQIVTQVGGDIWFDSEEGKGTSFYATIPLSGMKAKDGTKSLK